MVLIFGTGMAAVGDDLATNPREDWPTYGGSFSNQRFSRLGQLTTANVGRLRVLWTFPIPDAGVAGTSLQTTPLVVRGREAGLSHLDAIMYVTSPLGRVIALDAATGDRIWEFVPPLAEPLKLCCSRANRGIAFGRVRRFAGRVEARVYLATLDARLWALDASSGKPVTGFGQGQAAPGSVKVAEHDDGYSLTQAPLFIPRTQVPQGGTTQARDVIVIGVAGAEFGTRGSVTAYDARTGDLLWRFHTIPAPGEPGSETWPTIPAGRFAAPYRRGGGSVWMTPAYDPTRGWLFVAVGNPGPDLDGTHRAGDNLYTDSVVALDVRNGERVWHYQEVHHDLWDYDPASPPLLFDVGDTPAVAQAGKTGFFYVLDRRTGGPIFPCPETPVAESDIVAPDGSKEVTSPTQPVCGEGLQFVPFRRPGEVDDGRGSSPIFTPPLKGGTRVDPGIGGGSEWSPVAFHPGLGLAFVSGVVAPTDLYAVPARRPAPGQYRFGGITVPRVELFAGTFTAVDVVAGTRRWQSATRWPLVAGALATAGGLVFYGSGTPVGGALIALDAETGQERFRHHTRGGINAAPITFLANGRELVTVAAGGAPRYGSRLDNLLVTLGLEE